MRASAVLQAWRRYGRCGLVAAGGARQHRRVVRIAVSVDGTQAWKYMGAGCGLWCSGGSEGRGARYFLYCIGDIAFFGCAICDNTRKRMAVKRLAQVGERTGSGRAKEKRLLPEQ